MTERPAAAGPRRGQTLRFEAVTVTRGDRPALDGVTLTIDEPRVGIVGLNGSGKSTLLKLAVGLVPPASGRVTVDGRDVATEADAIRRDTGFLFQTPDNQIVLPIVGEDVGFGLKRLRLGRAETAARVAATLDRLGIGALSARRIHELSGGERQLVALAGMLALEPKTVLFDEPTSQLDLRNRNRFRDLLAALPEQALVVSHDLDLLADFPRVLVVEDGRIACDAPAGEALAFYRTRWQ